MGGGDEHKDQDKGLFSNLTGGGHYPPGQYPPAGGSYPPQGYPPAGGGGYPPQGYPPAGGGGYPPQGYPPAGGGGYPPQGYPPSGGGYPPQGYPPAGQHSGSSAPHKSGHGGIGGMLAGGAAAAAAAYGAQHLTGGHGGGHGGHSGGYGGHGGGYGGHGGGYKEPRIKALVAVFILRSHTKKEFVENKSTEINRYIVCHSIDDILNNSRESVET